MRRLLAAVAVTLALGVASPASAHSLGFSGAQARAFCAAFKADGDPCQRVGTHIVAKDGSVKVTVHKVSYCKIRIVYTVSGVKMFTQTRNLC